eukprot:11014732-Karenia_brevis.AAC.1
MPPLVDSSDEEEEEEGIPSKEELQKMNQVWNVQRHSRKRERRRQIVNLCRNHMCGCVGENCFEDRWVCPVETDDP